MMQKVQQVVLLADSSKFGQQALATLCRLDEIDIVVSDGNLGEEHRAMVKEAGCELILPESNGQAHEPEAPAPQ